MPEPGPDAPQIHSETPPNGPVQQSQPKKRSRRWLAYVLIGLIVIGIGGAVAAGVSIQTQHNAQATSTARAAAALATNTAQMEDALTWQAQVVATNTAAVQQVTAQAQATETAVANVFATQQAQITATAQSAQDVADVPSDWSLVLYDPFEEDTDRWRTGDYSDDLVTASLDLRNGGYVWTVKSHSAFYWWMRSNTGSFGDFYASVEGQRVSGAADSTYGLIFRLADYDNFYMFQLTDKGYFNVVRLSKGNWWRLLHKFSSAIDQDGPNQLAVRAEGSHFTLWINGQNVAEITDDRNPEGEIGVVIDLNWGGAENVIRFDNFILLAP